MLYLNHRPWEDTALSGCGIWCLSAWHSASRDGLGLSPCNIPASCPGGHTELPHPYETGFRLLADGLWPPKSTYGPFPLSKVQFGMLCNCFPPGQKFHGGHSSRPWPWCLFILAVCPPPKNSIPCGLSGLSAPPTLPSIMFLLFRNFLLCLASVITAFRHRCLLLGFWFIIGQRGVSSISTLVWTCHRLRQDPNAAQSTTEKSSKSSLLKLLTEVMQHNMMEAGSR